MYTPNGVAPANQLSDLLQEEQKQLRDEIAGLQKEISRKQDERQEKERRLGHIEALLGGEGQTAAEAKPAPRRRGQSTPKAEMLDMAVAVLRERNKEPMYYKDLVDELLRRGAIIGGVSPASGLVARMTGDERFVRPTSKGFYALREDYPEVTQSVGARRRKLRSQILPNNSEKG